MHLERLPWAPQLRVVRVVRAVPGPVAMPRVRADVDAGDENQGGGGMSLPVVLVLAIAVAAGVCLSAAGVWGLCERWRERRARDRAWRVKR